MIEILKIDKKRVKALKKAQHNCWINVIEPTPEEISKLKEIIDIPLKIIQGLQDPDEIPESEEYKGYTFLIIRTPYNSPKSELTYTTQPLGIFLHDDFVLTICYQKNDVIDRLKMVPFDFKKSQFVLRALLSASKLYLTYLKDMHKMMIKLEEELEVSQKNKVIMNFLELEKAFVYFDTSLKGNEILIEKLQKNKRLMKHKENKAMIDHIIEETRQGVQMVGVYSSILSNTLDAFASIISNNLNIVMKTLTSLTLIFNVPILIASIYGMNVNLPAGHSPYAFPVIMGISIFLSLIAVFIFAKKKFF